MAGELIVWTDDFLVGEESIDTQHKELVRLINEFYAGVQMGGIMTKVFYMQTIKGALHYIKTHFSNEESIMQKIEFPFYKEHKKLHEDFVAEVTHELKVFEDQDNPDPTDFIKFLVCWVSKHIADADKKMTSYLS